jgi:hypothetical protein
MHGIRRNACWVQGATTDDNSVAGARVPVALSGSLSPRNRLNHETKECGGFWGGDEYGGYRLPEGWVDYYPVRGMIETQIGSCSFPGTLGFEDPSEDRLRIAEACCQELGYTYAGTPVGKRFTTPLGWRDLLKDALAPCLACSGVVLLLAVSGVVLLRRRCSKRRGSPVPEP